MPDTSVSLALVDIYHKSKNLLIYNLNHEIFIIKNFGGVIKEYTN